MNDYRELVQETENKWLKILYRHVKEIFAPDPLPSHNEEHHHRVWIYSRELMAGLASHGIPISRSDIEDMIFSAFFHDTGMSITREEGHGLESRRICTEWLEKEGINTIRDTSRLLEAVEHHDKKAYLLPGKLSGPEGIDLRSILTLCDDLDAFGYPGIYRYSEIYLLRGIPLNELGQQVISNASRRFGNFMSSCMSLPEMIRIHTPRYDILESFFRQYNAQLRKDPSGSGITSGPVNVVKIFYRHILTGVNSVESLCSSADNESLGMYERNYFTHLRKEWCDVRDPYFT